MNWYLTVMRSAFDFSGRARRTEYWMFTLFNLIFSILANVIDVVIGLGILSVIYSLVVFIPGLAVSVRRLHDINKSGWNILLALIPLVGAIILLVFFVKEGDKGRNTYGPDPKSPENAGAENPDILDQFS